MAERTLHIPYGCGPEVEPLVSLASLRPVRDCPHKRVVNWRRWEGLTVEIGECDACGTTISREVS